MNKLLGIVILGLIWCSAASALTIRCVDHKEAQFLESTETKIGYGSVDIILDSSGSVHVTEYAVFINMGEVFGYSDANDPSGYQKK